MPARRFLAGLTALSTLAVACSSGNPRHTSAQPPPPQAATPIIDTPTPTPSPSVAPSVTHAVPTVAPLPTKPAPTKPAPTKPAAPNPSVLPTVPTGSGGATIAGCPLFPADNPWRRNVAADPLDPHSDAWVASVGLATFLHPDFGSNPTYGIPYVVVPASQPKVPIAFTAYGSESDPGPYPVPLNAPVESGSDRHVLVASADCHLYEMFGAALNGAGWNADSGAVFNLQSDALRPDTWTSADAAGLPILPGLVRWDEIQAGHIDHALRFTVASTQKGFIHPATHQAGSTTNPNVPPMGARFRLKASFDVTRFHGASRVILECLQRYGMYVADNGSNWYISGATDSRWNDDDLNQMKTVPGSAFEVVQTGSILH